MTQGEISSVNKVFQLRARKKKTRRNARGCSVRGEGFLLPVQQRGHAFFLVFGDGFQGGAGNQEGAFNVQFFRLFIPYLAEAGQVGFKLLGMLAALDVGTARIIVFIQQVEFLHGVREPVAPVGVEAGEGETGLCS